MITGNFMTFILYTGMYIVWKFFHISCINRILEKATKEGGDVYHKRISGRGLGLLGVHPEFRIFEKRVIYERKERKKSEKYFLKFGL